jgi:hypothetical protein
MKVCARGIEGTIAKIAKTDSENCASKSKYSFSRFQRQIDEKRSGD